MDPRHLTKAFQDIPPAKLASASVSITGTLLGLYSFYCGNYANACIVLALVGDGLVAKGELTPANLLKRKDQAYNYLFQPAKPQAAAPVEVASRVSAAPSKRSN